VCLVVVEQVGRRAVPSARLQHEHALEHDLGVDHEPTVVEVVAVGVAVVLPFEGPRLDRGRHCEDEQRDQRDDVPFHRTTS
jgi:hypothetical protein